MIHELKIQKQWADAKLAGEKPFEIRRNDRGFQKGDIVHYTVVDPKTGEPWRVPAGELPSSGDDHHALERCDFIITYVREGADGLDKGYCVFADQPMLKGGGRHDGPGKEFYLNAAKQIANLPPVCEPAFEHAKSGSNFTCPHLDTDGFHCKLKRGECRHQENLKNGNGQSTSKPEGLCKCTDLEKKRTCPYRLIKSTGDECFNPGECEGKHPEPKKCSCYEPEGGPTGCAVCRHYGSETNESDMECHCETCSVCGAKCPFGGNPNYHTGMPGRHG